MISFKFDAHSQFKSKFLKKNKKKQPQQEIDSPENFRRGKMSVHTLQNAIKKDRSLILFLSSTTIFNPTPIPNVWRQHPPPPQQLAGPVFLSHIFAPK